MTSAPRHLRRNLRYCTWDGVCATGLVYINLPGNLFVTLLLTKAYPMGDVLFGATMALPAFCNVLQVAVSGWLARRWSARAICLVASWVQTACWGLSGVAMSLLPTTEATLAGRVFFLLLALTAMVTSVVGVTWTSWIQEWVPLRVRPRYFGFRNSVLTLANVVFLLVLGQSLNGLSGPPLVHALQVLLAVVLGFRVVSILLQYRILQAEVGAEAGAGRPWREQWARLRGASSFVWTVAFGATWVFTTSLFGTFFGRFMLDGLRLDMSTVTLLGVAGGVAGALSLPAWGQILQRHGSRPVLMLCGLCWTVPGLGWSWCTPEDHGWLWPMWISGGVWGAGFVLAQFTLLLKVVPPEAKTVAVSVNIGVTSLAGAVAPILGGWGLEALKAGGLEPLGAYQLGSAVHHVAAALSVLVLLKVVEPRATDLMQLVGAMRSARQIAALLGLTFLQNWFFFRRRPVPR